MDAIVHRSPEKKDESDDDEGFFSVFSCFSSAKKVNQPKKRKIPAN